MGLQTPEAPAALLIERVAVGPARIEALVRVAAGAPMRTSEVPGLTEAALALLPGLRRHRCECGSPHGIAAELADTEITHLLEHVALELMALSGSPRTLAGETRWDFATDGRGVFRIELDYDDDLVALGALREAMTLLVSMLEGVADAAGVDGAVARLVEVRGPRV